MRGKNIDAIPYRNCRPEAIDRACASLSTSRVSNIDQRQGIMCRGNIPTCHFEAGSDQRALENVGIQIYKSTVLILGKKGDGSACAKMFHQSEE